MSIARSYSSIIAGLAMVLLGACRSTPSAPTAVLRLSLPHAEELVIGGGPEYEFGLAVAPDGRRLVFPATDTSHRHALWLRDLSSGDLRPLPGTDGGVMPFWSPDGAAIAFFADGKLRILDVASGEIRAMTDAPAPRGGVWLASGDIVFAPTADSGLLRRARDGTTVTWTTLVSGEVSHRLPQALGGDHVVFFVRASETARQGLWIAPLGAPDARRRLVDTDAGALPVDDAIVYANGEALVLQRIDLEHLSLASTPHLLATRVGRGAEHQVFAAAGGDVLIFGAPASTLRELRWVDRSGVTARIVGEPMHAWEIRIAPAAPRVAVTRSDPQLRTLDIWVYEDDRPLPRRVSPSINVDETPVWSRDGSRIAWVSARRALIVRDARAAAAEETLRKFDRRVRVSDWSPDGAWLVVSEMQADSRSDVLVVPTRPEGQPRIYLRSPFNETHGAISPDGRWLAYVSDESGQPEIYVDSMPAPRARARLTMGGGTEPRWTRDGTRIFFRRGREVHEVRVQAAGSMLEAAASERLFTLDAEIRSFDVAPDGARFLVNVPASAAPSDPMTVLVNVGSLLRSAP